MSEFPSSIPPRPSSSIEILRLVSAVAVLGASVACGNGGGGGDGGGAAGAGGGPGGTAAQPGHLEFFQASLHAVDPADPATILTIDADASEIGDGTNNIGALPVLEGSMQGGGTVTDLSIAAVIYARNDGTLQRVSTDGSNGTPVPEQVSSEDNALPLCDARLAFDLVDVDNTQYVYGSDGNDCSEELSWKSVRFSDGEADDPVDFPGMPIEALIDPVDGKYAGWLAVDGSVLRRLAPDLSSQTDSLSGVQIGVESLGQTGNGTVFLEIDNGLFAFDPQSDTLIDFDFTFSEACPCSTHFATDDQFGYLIDANELIQADAATATASALDVATDASPFAFGFLPFLSVGTSRVAWSYPSDVDGNPATFDDQVIVVRSVAKDGSGAFDLDSLPLTFSPLGFFSAFLSASGGDWVFYDSQEAVGANLFQSTAIAARLDGTSRLRFPQSVWIGDSVSSGFLGNRAALASHVIRLDGVVDLGNLGNNLLSLHSLDASAPDGASIALGDLPTDAEFAFFLPGFGPARMGALVATDGFGNGQSDVIFIDVETPNSLSRLTMTDGITEFPAAGF